MVADEVWKTCEGNAGAMRVGIELVRLGKADLLLKARDKGYSGRRLWMLYRVECKFDIQKVVAKLSK